MEPVARKVATTRSDISALRRRCLAATLGLAFCGALMSGSQVRPAHAGVYAAAGCRNAKAKAAGKQAGDMLKALAKHAKKPDSVKLIQSVSKAESKLTKAFAKAEGKGGCDTIGDVDDIKGGVEAFVGGVNVSVASESASGQNPLGPTTVTTDTEEDGATPYDNVETAVTDPGGGSVTITETTTTVVPPPGFTLIGTEVDIDITGPVPTAVDPYVLIFRLDSTLSSAIILTALELLDVQVFQYNATFPDGRLVNPCTGDGATPDPCVRRSFDTANNDVVLTVFTTTASRWAFGTPKGTPDDCCTALNPQAVNFAFTGSGTCGILRNFRCAGDVGAPACATDADCPGTGPCAEVVAGNLPLDLDCGALYFGGGINSVPLPVVLPGMTVSSTDVTSCNATSGELTLGPRTPAETGSTRTCTSGRRCSGSAAACVADSDCPATETCDTQCLFGAPVPVPNAGASVCLVLDVQTDAAGTATCNGDVALDLPLRMNVFLPVNGDVLTAADPPDVPGVQPCPICVRQCIGGVSDQFPCTDDSDCVAGVCAPSTVCLGGPNDGLACTPGSADLGDSYRTSHDCPSDPLQDISPTGGIELDLALTTGQVTTNAVDLPFPGISRSFCGDSQANSGAFTEFEATQISLTGTPAPPSLGGDSRLVTSFCVPATDSFIINAAADLPGPGAVMLLGEVSVSP